MRAFKINITIDSYKNYLNDCIAFGCSNLWEYIAWSNQLPKYFNTNSDYVVIPIDFINYFDRSHEIKYYKEKIYCCTNSIMTKNAVISKFSKQIMQDKFKGPTYMIGCGVVWRANTITKCPHCENSNTGKIRSCLNPYDESKAFSYTSIPINNNTITVAELVGVRRNPKYYTSTDKIKIYDEKKLYSCIKCKKFILTGFNNEIPLCNKHGTDFMIHVKKYPSDFVSVYPVMYYVRDTPIYSNILQYYCDCCNNNKVITIDYTNESLSTVYPKCSKCKHQLTKIYSV